MGAIKSYGMGLAGLLIAIIALMVILNLLKKVPVVGKVAELAQDLATDGKVGA
jgi:quinol-cytochrome oxidoreductase complex cytochrome b subunit